MMSSLSAYEALEKMRGLKSNIIDLSHALHKKRVLNSARREIRKWGFTAREMNEMENGSLISTSDPRFQRMVMDALAHRGWKYD